MKRRYALIRWFNSACVLVSTIAGIYAALLFAPGRTVVERWIDGCATGLAVIGLLAFTVLHDDVVRRAEEEIRAAEDFLDDVLGG